MARVRDTGKKEEAKMIFAFSSNDLGDGVPFTGM